MSRGGSAPVTLRAHYGGTAALHFSIVKPPAHGRLSGWRPLGSNQVGVLYQHDGSTEDEDRFTYVAQAAGRSSSPAEVLVTVQDAAARLEVPATLDFGEIVAGETATRALNLTNAGGGVLSGRVAVSSPWVVVPTEFQVEAGKTEAVQVAFRPDESKTFVGQVTVTAADGEVAIVGLDGSAKSPLQVAPSPVLLRNAKVTLTNLTTHSLPLSFKTSTRIQRIAPVELPAHGEATVGVVVRPETTGAVQEDVVIVGPHFTMPLSIDAPSLAPATPSAPTAASTPFVVTATPAATPRVAVQNPIAAPPEAAASPTQNPSVHVTAKRLGPARWELQWRAEKTAAANYALAERTLAVNARGELVVSWQRLTGAKISAAAEEVRAEIDRLVPHQLHMICLSAFGPDGAPLWEAPLVALPPAPTSDSTHNVWLPGLLLLLAFCFFLRCAVAGCLPNDQVSR